MRLFDRLKSRLLSAPVSDPGTARALEALDSLDDGSEFWKGLRRDQIRFGIEREKSGIFTGRIMRGQQYEKDKDIDNAIKEYEAGIADLVNNVYSLIFPHHRLMVIYRRMKDYDNEIRVIKIALKVPGVNVEDYEKRLKKARLRRDNSISATDQ